MSRWFPRTYETVADLPPSMLVLIGCIYRLVAYFGLILVHRDKQR